MKPKIQINKINPTEAWTELASTICTAICWQSRKAYVPHPCFIARSASSLQSNSNAEMLILKERPTNMVTIALFADWCRRNVCQLHHHGDAQSKWPSKVVS